MKRRPVQTLLLTMAVVAGLGIGVMITQQRAAVAAIRRPDVHLRHADPGDLTRHGFRLSGREPANWSDIDLRMMEDDHGGILCLRCVIAPDEVDRLLDWPLGSRCPVDPRPPGDWPWGSDGEAWSVPEWWRPEAGRMRLFERIADDVTGRGEGLFARYDHDRRVLFLWRWQRAGWRPVRTDAAVGPVIDQVVLRLGGADVVATAGADGWRQVPASPWSVTGLSSYGATEIIAAIHPVARHHRYLIAIRGVDEVQAWRLAADQPLHPMPDDGPVPIGTWMFAVPATGMPVWFRPGAGPRRCHVLVRVGSGKVDAGRWLAYDRSARTLFVWDWADGAGRSAEADLLRGMERPR